MKVTFLEKGKMNGKQLSIAIANRIAETVNGNEKVVLLVPDDRAADTWDKFLWTFSQSSFLPHSIFDGSWNDAEPMVIATQFIPSFQGAVLFCLNDTPVERLTEVQNIVEVVHSDDDEKVAEARKRWLNWKELGAEIHYRQEWA